MEQINLVAGQEPLRLPGPLYLAGPIRGIKNYRERFTHAAALLRYNGYKVFNPVEQDVALERSGVEVTIANCLELDLAYICRYAQGVAFLAGWCHSTGAIAEWATARAIGTPTWELPREYNLSDMQEAVATTDLRVRRKAKTVDRIVDALS